MKRCSGVALIVSSIALIGSVQYAFGGAVMSVDLGCEWMKVSERFVGSSNGTCVDINCNFQFNRLVLYRLAFQWKLR